MRISSKKEAAILTESRYSYCMVKENGFSKNAIIRHKSELIHHFRLLIEDEPDLVWRIPSQESSSGDLRSVELSLRSGTPN